MAHLALKALEPEQRRSLQALARGAAWLVGTAAVLRLLMALLSESPMAATLFTAIVADLAARRAGVGWDETHAVARDAKAPPDADRWKPTLRRILVGTDVAAAVLVACLAIGAALGLARVSAGKPAAALLPSLVRAVATAVRDELLLRGLVLAACTRARVPVTVAVCVAGLAGGASVLLEDGAGPAAVLLACSTGLLFASLWRAGAAWAAIAGHAAWSLIATALFRGALLDVTWSSGSLTTGARAYGAPAWLAAAVAAAAGAAILLRSRKRDQPRAAAASR